VPLADEEDAEVTPQPDETAVRRARCLMSQLELAGSGFGTCVVLLRLARQRLALRLSARLLTCSVVFPLVATLLQLNHDLALVARCIS